MYVLVADDSSVIRRIIRRSLESFRGYGLQIIETDNERDALRLALAAQLIVLDWHLGVDILRRLNDLVAGTPVLVVFENELESRTVNADHYLIKPFNKYKFEAKILEMLPDE